VGHGACNTHGKKRNVYNVLVGEPEGNRPLEIPRRKWEYNIKNYFKEIGYEGVIRIHDRTRI
jgi:hypothetical protein